MNHINTLLYAFVFVCCVGIFYFFGAHNDLFYILPWYDIPLHILAGVGVGFFAIWIQQAIWPATTVYRASSFVWMITFVLSITIVWELFELYGGLTMAGMITPMGLTYGQDTTKDICIGLLGGYIAFIMNRNSLQTK